MEQGSLLLEAIKLIRLEQTETAADAVKITKLLAEGLDVNIQIDPKKLPLFHRDSRGFSLLHLAIIHCTP